MSSAEDLLRVSDALQAMREKAISEDVLRRGSNLSVVAKDPNRLQPGHLNIGVLYLAGFADGIPNWGQSPIARDILMRQFILQGKESMTTSAFSTIIARNCAFDWALDGPNATTQRVMDMLQSCDEGRGWEYYIATTSLDMLTCDRGAFTEIIREENSPTAPVITFKHLDSAKCWPTGDPVIPVIYQDRNGAWHEMRWYQVIQHLEMPAGLEDLPGMQISAMTRVLRAAQIFRNIQTYTEEKTGGRFSRAVNLISGITQKQLDDALALQSQRADAQLLQRYVTPLTIAAVDPEHPPTVASFEIASLPDGFNAETEFKNFLTILAMGLLSDYQEFAPLPGGNLGTSSQSEILHLKSRGKGPGLFMKLVANAFNYHGVLPRNVTFRWDEQDVEADKASADVSLTRAEVRKQMLLNGEIDAAGARQMALDSGDLTPELARAMDSSDLTPGASATSNVAIEDNNPDVAIKDLGDAEERAALEAETAANMQSVFRRIMNAVRKSARS